MMVSVVIGSAHLGLCVFWWSVLFCFVIAHYNKGYKHHPFHFLSLISFD